ncbi:MAG: peptidase [Halobacteriovoraceae bacterium]|nr:peptidase [Halobacteriovoraceae bacterium]
MKNTLIVLLLATTSVLMAGTKGIKVIYGEDNRVDVMDSTNNMFVELSQSTAAMIPSSDLRAQTNGEVQIRSKTLQSSMRVCSTERFANQPTAANCSGFLVGENLLVTAGHCIRSQRDCSSNDWVFDYKLESKNQSGISVDKNSVYKCKRIISQKLSNWDKDDYALIELDRKVTDRRVLDFRRKGKVAKGADLVVIGHPSGLPTKIADGAKVRSLKGKFFVANLDTYGGNSGSAVFDANTGVIEGILVRGETDYISRGGCRVSNEVSDDAGRGEDVTYILNIPELSNL